MHRGTVRSGIGPAASHEGDGGARTLTFPAFNTDIHLHAYASDGQDAADPAVRARLDAALAACRGRCWHFERLFSRTRPDSDIARAHAASPGPVPVAPETAELVELALGYCARSEGFLDITMGTVTSLWDFHRGVVPSRLALSRALAHVGYGKVRVTRSDARAGATAHGAGVAEGGGACASSGCWAEGKERAASGPDGSAAGNAACALAIDDPATILDLGGVAKGYIADDLAALLEAAGVQRFALNLGGNVLVRGGRPRGVDGGAIVPEGLPWRIGIADPFDSSRTCAVVELADGSVATSGARERRFSRGGTTYHHILSPVDGMPAKTDVASASIVAARSMDCDGYSTTVFMMGAEHGLAFAEEIAGVDAVVVTEAGEVRWTSGLDGRLALSSHRPLR